MENWGFCLAFVLWGYTERESRLVLSEYWFWNVWLWFCRFSHVYTSSIHHAERQHHQRESSLSLSHLYRLYSFILLDKILCDFVYFHRMHCMQWLKGISDSVFNDLMTQNKLKSISNEYTEKKTTNNNNNTLGVNWSDDLKLLHSLKLKFLDFILDLYLVGIRMSFFWNRINSFGVFPAISHGI